MGATATAEGGGGGTGETSLKTLLKKRGEDREEVLATGAEVARVAIDEAVEVTVAISEKRKTVFYAARNTLTSGDALSHQESWCVRLKR